MKKVIPFILVGFFILGGINVVATNENLNDIILENNDVEIHFAPITIPNNEYYSIINGNGEQTNQELKIYTIAYKKESKNVNNYKELKGQHKTKEMLNNLETYDYVIITTENLYDSITFSTFIGWKTLVGFNVKIVNITDSEIASQAGGDLPEKIRNFLRAYYQEWGIKYVLFVGNHATIPMRYCYPDPTNHRFDIFDYTSGEVPTDYYYADLSEIDSDSWDNDGDGYYGEYGQDLPDFYPEVYVGRIPTNIKSRITYTLDKLVTFEQDTGDWKENALHAGAFFYFTNEDNSGNPAMDGAKLSYYIENDIMLGWTISHYSEQQGLEKSVYNWPALSESSFINDWRNGQYSIVNWQGHGWTNRVARKVWSGDDGNGIPEYDEISWPDFININSNLDDDYPSIVTAESCYVGCPEPATGGNLGIDLLTNPTMGASIGVIASARSPYGSFEWPYPPGGSDSIIYEFNNFMINESKAVGEALYDSKYYCNYNFGWDHWVEYLDLYTFNLFGDPSLAIEGITTENLPPEKPTINGPNKGSPGKEYNYSIIASDPDDDTLYVQWDWGDGTTSDWQGPYSSGTEVLDSHSWAEKGTVMLSVIVEDEHGLSVTAYKEIMIPRARTTHTFLQRIIERFPNLFPVLRYTFNF